MDPNPILASEEKCRIYLLRQWDSFLNQQFNDDLQLTKTTLYNLIAIRFTALLTRMLLRTADDVTANVLARPRICSALLIQDMAQSNHLDTAYAANAVDAFNKEFFGSIAIKLLKGYPDWSPLNAAGKELCKKLLRLAIQRRDAWYYFAQQMRHYFQEYNRSILYRFLSVFCELEEDNLGLEGGAVDDLRRGYALDIQPILVEYTDRFRLLLVDLLRQEADESKNYRAFQILQFFHHIFNHEHNHRNELIEAAIMSPLFDRRPFNQRTLAAAIYVMRRIERGDEFGVSRPIIRRRLNTIAFRLYQMSTPRSVIAARQFAVMISRRN